MSEFRVQIVDPSTGQTLSEEELPQLFEVVTSRRYARAEPNILTVTTEPLMQFMKRSYVDAVPIWPTAEEMRAAGNVEHNDCVIGTDCVEAVLAALGYKIEQPEADDA